MATAMLICCYGNYDPDHRSALEMKGYEEYLQGVAKLIAERRPEYVVLCGGHTRSELGKSEAASVLPALEAFLTETRQNFYELPNVTFLLEERSLDTPQNLSYGLSQLTDRELQIDELTAVCDHVRRWKVIALMWRLTNLRWRVVGIHRLDDHPHSTPFHQFLAALKYLLWPRKSIFP